MSKVILGLVLGLAVSAAGFSYFLSRPLKELVPEVQKNPPVLSVIVNGKTWDIWAVESLPDRYWANRLEKDDADAETLCGARQIMYTAQATNVRTILWHELFHAGACPEDSTYWNSKSDEDHVGIYRLADFMGDFTRNNPEFMKWEME